MERIGLAPGTPIGGYTIISRLGAGGMGAVYRAVDDGGTQVALKMLHPHVSLDPVARERLRREVRALQRLDIDGVARVIDAETESPEPFLVTELVEGESLESAVHREGPLSAADIAELATAVQVILSQVHQAGVLHRDLKPANVMLTRTGPVLIDFGLATSSGEAAVTSVSLIAGSPGYLAPEIIEGRPPSAAADWWGAAAVLVFAATGRHPFGTGPVAAVLARSGAGKPDLDGVSGIAVPALTAALAPEPDKRPDPMQLVEVLQAWSQGRAVGDAAVTQWIDPSHDGRTLEFVQALAEPPSRTPPVTSEPGRRPEVYEYGSGNDRLRPGHLELARYYGTVDDDEYDNQFDDDADDALGVERSGASAWLVLVVFALLVVAAGALWPFVTFAAVGLVSVLLRTFSAAAAAAAVRPRGWWPGLLQVLSLPGYLVWGAIGAVPGLIVGLLAGFSAGGLIWWALGWGPWDLPLQTGQPLEGLLVSLGAGLLVLLMAAVSWSGPVAAATRDGAARLGAKLVWHRRTAVAVAAAALLGAAFCVYLVAVGYPVVWLPMRTPVMP